MTKKKIMTEPEIVYSFRLRQRHREANYCKIIQTIIGQYFIDKNMIVVYINPKVINVYGSYRDYGFRGLIRSLSVTIVHELIHWATELLENSGHETDSWNKTLNSIVYRTTAYSIYKNESYYKNDKYEGDAK